VIIPVKSIGFYNIASFEKFLVDRFGIHRNKSFTQIGPEGTDQIVRDEIYGQIQGDLVQLNTRQVVDSKKLTLIKPELSGKGLARYLSARFQPLPIRTTREVFPQAAHPTIFVERVMGPVDSSVHFHLYASALFRG